MPKTCTKCGSEVPENSSQGYCPRCLLRLAEETLVGVEPSGGGAVADGFFHPSSFGDYELLDRLGEGGMGVVFKAVQKKLNRIVAIKMLRSGSLATNAEVKRFLLEAQAAGRLRHPNIVPVHEAGEHNGLVFYSMDWIQGRSLAEILGSTPLPPARAAKYALAISDAVHHAHTQGILHRDLKPGNVLVDDRDQPHITDFGLAKETSGDNDITGSGLVLGTPSYMSPEQAACRRELVRATSDVYSLGAVLYDMVTGRPPFRADSPAETMRQVLEQEPAPPRLLNAKVPRDLETICLKCLAKDPARRYASAQLLADDLGRFLRGEAILARRPGWLERSYLWARRYPARAGLVAALSAMFLLLGVIALLTNREARESVKAAPFIAKGFARDFEGIGAVVARFAADQELRSMIATNPTPAPRDQTNRLTNPFVARLAGLLDSEPGTHQFENWLLLTTNGTVLANLTADSNALPLTNSLAFRDYFQGATRLLTNRAAAYHISKVYRSESDFRHKVGISAPIRSAQDDLVGVIVRMVWPDDQGGIQTSRSKTVLLGELDPNQNPLKPGPTPLTRYVVFAHPALLPNQVFPIPDTGPLRHTLDQFFARGAGREFADYTDPVGAKAPRYRGGWVAYMARVPGTNLVEVYQVRDRVRQAAFAAGLLLLPCSLFLGLPMLRNRLRARRPAGD